MTNAHKVKRVVISHPKSLSDIRKIYSKVVTDFRINFFGYQNLQYACMLEIQNISDFSSQCFGYHISDIVSDIRKPFRICYEASPNE